MPSHPDCAQGCALGRPQSSRESWLPFGLSCPGRLAAAWWRGSACLTSPFITDYAAACLTGFGAGRQPHGAWAMSLLRIGRIASPPRDTTPIHDRTLRLIKKINGASDTAVGEALLAALEEMRWPHRVFDRFRAPCCHARRQLCRLRPSGSLATKPAPQPSPPAQPACRKRVSRLRDGNGASGLPLMRRKIS